MSERASINSQAMSRHQAGETPGGGCLGRRQANGRSFLKVDLRSFVKNRHPSARVNSFYKPSVGGVRGEAWEALAPAGIFTTLKTMYLENQEITQEMVIYLSKLLQKDNALLYSKLGSKKEKKTSRALKLLHINTTWLGIFYKLAEKQAQENDS